MVVTRLLRTWGLDGFAGHTVAVLFATLVLAASAKVQVPFWPVPMTLQTLAVITIGMLYGSRLGAVTLLAYVAEGAVGLPVFASGAGLAYLAGPTAGYLLGFVLAAYLAGRLAEQGWTGLLPAIAVNALGTMLILAVGWGWLATRIGPEAALTAGVVPFLVSSLLKIVLGGTIVAALARKPAGRP